MSTKLIAKNYGSYKEYVGLYAWMEKCKTVKFIYLSVTTKNGMDEHYKRANINVAFKYLEPKNIPLIKDFNEFMTIDKDIFFEKLDEAKAIIDHETKDEVDTWLKDKFEMTEDLRNNFWTYIVNARRKIIEDTKRR